MIRSQGQTPGVRLWVEVGRFVAFLAFLVGGRRRAEMRWRRRGERVFRGIRRLWDRKDRRGKWAFHQDRKRSARGGGSDVEEGYELGIPSHR